MHDFFASGGYGGLFLLSFLAATVVPLGSEWLLVIMLMKGWDPVTTVAVATAGNFLGACTTWWIGIGGGRLLMERVLRIDDRERGRAERLYARYGSWTLLFSWVPIVGDPLCLVAGLLRVRLARFAPLVLAGKLGRYSVLAWMVS